MATKIYTHRPCTVGRDGDCRRKIVLINSIMAPQRAVINVTRLATCRPPQTEAEVCLTTRSEVNSITWPSCYWWLEVKLKGEASFYVWNLANKQVMRMPVTDHSDCSCSVLSPPSHYSHISLISQALGFLSLNRTASDGKLGEGLETTIKLLL